MRLLLIRHGQTPSNVGNHLDTARPGAGLTALGLEQAAALPRLLADEPIGALYASTLVRTQLTGQPLAEERGLEIAVRDGIREIEAGSLEMADDVLSIRRYMTTVIAWSSGRLATRMPGVESDGRDFLDRFDAVVAEAVETGAAAGGSVPGAVALVSHGAAIRTWCAQRAENLDGDFAARHEMPNTGVVVLEGEPGGGWKALSWAGTPLGG